MIPALVLTAGLATRLRPLSRVRAKAALPVAGEPLVIRILRSLAAAGIRDAVLNLHHLPQTITDIVGTGLAAGVSVRYSWEVPVLGSAGGPRRALPLLAAPTFLIVNGDTLTDVEVPELIEHHRRSGALVTMAVVPNTEPEKYGGVLVAADGGVAGFTRRGSLTPSYHFIGVQAAEAAAFASLPDNTPSESVGTLYPRLLAQRPGSIRAFVSSAEFLDIGTPADYLRTCILVAGREHRPDPLTGSRADIHPHAILHESILWDDVVIGADARLRHCIVTDGVCVPAGATFEYQTIRVAAGDLEPGETRSGDLAVAPIDTA